MPSKFFSGFPGFLLCPLFLLILTPVGGHAQADTASFRPSYFMAVHAGALAGRFGAGSTYTASYIQGIRYKRASAGLGVGYDAHWEWRTVPYFLSLSYDMLAIGGQWIFLRTDAGYSYMWNSPLGEREGYFNEEGGVFLHPMAGMRLRTGKVRVYLTAGYKVQRVSYAEQYGGWYGATRKSTDREMQRVSIQLGFGFQ